MKSYNNRRGLITSATILCVGLAWIWASRVTEKQPGAGALEAPQTGFIYPQFALGTVSGGTFDTSSLAGKPLVINFWASWCPPYKAEMPDFQKASREFAGTDLVLAAVNATNQDSYQEVLSFIESNQLSFTIPLDQDGMVTRTYNVHSLPTTYFINREGRIEKVMVGGPIPLALLRVEINNLLED